METAPVPPEWSGNPSVMFVIDTTITMESDFAQTPLTGLTRMRFIQLIEKYLKDWYITPLIKCKPKNLRYTSKDLKICTSWIEEEIGRVKPKIIVGCGSKVPIYTLCDFEAMAPNRIIQSKKHEEMFEGLLKKIKEQISNVEKML